MPLHVGSVSSPVERRLSCPPRRRLGFLLKTDLQAQLIDVIHIVADRLSGSQIKTARSSDPLKVGGFQVLWSFVGDIESTDSQRGGVQTPQLQEFASRGWPVATG